MLGLKLNHVSKSGPKYFAIRGKLLGIFWDNFTENWLCYTGSPPHNLSETICMRCEGPSDRDITSGSIGNCLATYQVDSWLWYTLPWHLWLNYPIKVVGATERKLKCHHFGEIVITGSTWSCQNDNFQCSKWWKIHQNDTISVSMWTSFTLWLSPISKS